MLFSIIDKIIQGKAAIFYESRAKQQTVKYSMCVLIVSWGADTVKGNKKVHHNTAHIP